MFFLFQNLTSQAASHDLLSTSMPLDFLQRQASPEDAWTAEFAALSLAHCRGRRADLSYAAFSGQKLWTIRKSELEQRIREPFLCVIKTYWQRQKQGLGTPSNLKCKTARNGRNEQHVLRWTESKLPVETVKRTHLGIFLSLVVVVRKLWSSSQLTWFDLIACQIFLSSPPRELCQHVSKCLNLPHKVTFLVVASTLELAEITRNTRARQSLKKRPNW